MKKNLKYIIGIAIAFTVAVALFVAITPAYKTKANVNALTIRSSNTQNPVAANSTTTRVFMTPGTGTTTITNYTENADLLQNNVQFESSSTASTLAWQNEYSDDNVNWFEEDNFIQPTTLGVVISAFSGLANTDHASTTVVHRWNPGTVATSSKSFPTPPYPARYTRIKYFLPAGSANGTMWAQTTLKTFNNQ